MLRRASKTLHFTKAKLAELESPDEGRDYFYDDKVAGLALCITPAGTKSFYSIRRVEMKVRRIHLGTWPEMSVEQARDHAARHNGKIADGIDPAIALQAKRGAPTFREAFEAFIVKPPRNNREKTKAERSAITLKGYRMQFDNYLTDWHSRKLSAITRRDVEELHNRLGKKPGIHTANRVLSLVKAVFNSAMEDDGSKVISNPAAPVKAFTEEPRPRFIEQDEFPRFWKALAAEPSLKVRDCIKLSLFIGQRTANTKAMRWADLNLERGEWMIPQTKTGSHTVPLPPEALEVLKRREKSKGDSEFVFPGRHGREHLKDFMRQWRSILKAAGLSDLRPHDLRRTLGAWQASGGASIAIIGKTLGHKPGSPVTAKVYAQLTQATVASAMSTATAAMMKAAKPAKRKGGHG